MYSQVEEAKGVSATSATPLPQYARPDLSLAFSKYQPVLMEWPKRRGGNLVGVSCSLRGLQWRERE